MILPSPSTGTDYLGPFFVTRVRGKSVEKRYGVILTCLVSRAVHIEIANTLDTDSFVNTLRRFVFRRGPDKMIRSGNGTNLVSGNRELKLAVEQWNVSQISYNCKILAIDWKFNSPGASHFGGVYEREIRTIRKVLSSLMSEFRNMISMTDDVLSTLMCEVENTLNIADLSPL